MNHNMTMAQFLEYQRLLEKEIDPERVEALSRILEAANVTNPMVISISR